MKYILLPNGDVYKFKKMTVQGNHLLFNGIHRLDYRFAQNRKIAHDYFLTGLNDRSKKCVTVLDPDDKKLFL